jgi:hypothetical protein
MMFNLLKFKIKDRRGNLSVVEGDAIPLMLKEYYLYEAAHEKRTKTLTTFLSR